MISKEVFGEGGNKEVKVDVVVIGGGPSGSAAAKNCARRGMSTLLLEKRMLPRRKICSGMIISNLSHALIASEFGVIPNVVLTDPCNLSGYQWHTSDYGDERQEIRIINVWRSELDYWMNQKAREAGAEIWEGARVNVVVQEDNEIVLAVKTFERQQKIRTRFVVGADGAVSVTRRSLFPSLNIRYIPVYAECHSGALDVDRDYFHIFGSSRRVPTNDWFDVIHKKGCFVIEVNGRVRHPREAMLRAKEVLATRWGFEEKNKSLWTGGTVVAILREALFTGKFVPAKGNILLVGDAAGVAVPTEKGSGEGIGTALKSGVIASAAIIRAADTRQEAAAMYITQMSPLIETCKAITADVINLSTVKWAKREKMLNELI